MKRLVVMSSSSLSLTIILKCKNHYNYKCRKIEHCVQSQYAERCNAECRYCECRGALKICHLTFWPIVVRWVNYWLNDIVLIFLLPLDPMPGPVL
jgi:hypothetical protein